MNVCNGYLMKNTILMSKVLESNSISNEPTVCEIF